MLQPERAAYVLAVHDLLDQPHDERHERRRLGDVGDLAQPAQGVRRPVAELARGVLAWFIRSKPKRARTIGDDQAGDRDGARVAHEVRGHVVDGPARAERRRAPLLVGQPRKVGDERVALGVDERPDVSHRRPR